MSTNNLTLKSISEEWIEKNPIQDILNLQFGQCHISVHSNSSELIQKLRYYYKDFIRFDASLPNISVTTLNMDEPPELGIEYTLKQPDPGKTKLKEEFHNLVDGRIVRKRLTGMLFLFGNGFNLALGPCVTNDNQVINFINNRFIEWVLHQNALLGHAAAVELNGRGLALAGFSGAGKSSLALQLMNLGVRFISNDRIMIKKAKENKLDMFGVAKLPRVNPGTVLNNKMLQSVIPEAKQNEFALLPNDELWDLEYKYDVFIDQCFGENKFLLAAPMDGLVILNWTRDESPMEIKVVNLNERRDLLPAFMKSVGLFFEGTPEKHGLDFSESAYTDYLQRCTVIEITGGVDFKKGADCCYRFLETGAI